LLRTKKTLDVLFNPHSVAIVGASHDLGKVGGQIFKNALSSHKLKVFPINPNHTSISEHKCYSTLLDIKEKVDVVVIAVKAEIVPLVVEQIVVKSIPYAIIISSGFKEAGEEGIKHENKIKEIIKNSSTKILGPNCLGIITKSVNLSFGQKFEVYGKIAVVSQSGAIGTALVDYINQAHIGLNSFVSLGNKVDLSENDFLEYYDSDPNTQSVFLYLESFKNGNKFFQLTRSISSHKPVIVLKPGATKNAVRAMTSHTGALISDAMAYKTAFSQANVINAESLEDFFILMKYFSSAKQNTVKNSKNDACRIITNAGGLGVLLADLLPNTIPFDLGGAAKAIDYEAAFKKLPRNLEALFCVMTPQEVTEIEETAHVITAFQKKIKYPVFTILPGGNKILPAHEILNKNNCLVFDFPEDAVRLYNKIMNYELNKTQNAKLPASPEGGKVQNQSSKRKSIRLSSQLSIQEIQQLAHEYRLPINDEYVVSTFDQCRQIAKKIGYPVVLKIHGPKFLHKTEFNAVRLNIKNEEELHKEYKELLTLQNTITISKQIPAAFEVIIGVKRDPDFGHLLMFGMGGIYTEIMKDLSYGLIPLSRAQIINLIKKTKSYQIINGARGLPRLDLKGIIDCIEKLNKLILENPWISELDINPLLVGENFVKIVDLKIK
jgi:acetyltransferase